MLAVHFIIHKYTITMILFFPGSAGGMQVLLLHGSKYFGTVKSKIFHAQVNMLDILGHYILC